MVEQAGRIDAASWALVIGLTVITSALALFWNFLTPYSLACAYQMGTIEWVMEITLLPFIGVIMLSALSRIGSFRQKMNLGRITYLYTAFTVTSYFIQPAGLPFLSFGRFITDRIIYPTQSQIAYEWFIVPAADIGKQLLAGGIPVPWAEWVPSILFWWTEVFLVSFFLICAANIFRRQWLDVEQVTFPITVAAHEIIDNIVSGGSGEKKGRSKVFIIGMVLGFIVQLPIGLAFLFPWFPDIYGWRTNTCPSGFGYVTADSPFLGQIVGLIGARKAPLAYFIAYLAPMTILFNVWFWYLAFVLVAQISYIMGFYTGILERTVCGRAYCGLTPMLSPPMESVIVAGVGGTIMLTIMMLYLSRSYILETIRAALGRLPADRIQEIERNEALSYRLNYLAVVVSYILIVGLFIAIGSSPLHAILMPIVPFVWWFSSLRVYGSTGLQTGSTVRTMAFPRLLYGEWGDGGPVPFTRDFGVTVYFMTSPSGDMPSMGWGGGMFSSFAGYRMASATGASNKGVFRVAVLSTLIVPLVSIVTFLIITYAYGANKLPMGGYFSGGGALYQYVIRPSSSFGAYPWVPYALIGMLVVGFLSIMHAHYIWFPFEPIGFIIGWSDTGISMGYWSAFAVAWVAKFITLRLGGSKAYENNGVPFVVGGVAGCIISIFLIGLMFVLRFFVPF